MKILKNTFAILLIAFISINVNAQEDNTNSKSVNTTSQTPENQKKSECELFKIIILNSANSYASIVGKEKENESIFKLYSYKKQMPNRFIEHYIDEKHSVFNLTTYRGSDKKKAEEKFIELYNAITNDCFDSLNKEFTFIKDDKANYSTTGNRNYFLTTTKDNILIKIQIRNTKIFNDNKLVNQHETSVSFIGLKDKQKVINKILNK